VAQLVEALRYKTEGHGIIPDDVTGHTMAPRLTQPLTETSTRNISWGVKAAGA